MKSRENSLNNAKNFKITKSGLLENDRKLLINKLGLNNLSQINSPKGKEKQNNFDISQNAINNQKNDNKISNKTSIINIQKNHTNFFQNKNITTNSSNEIIVEPNRYRKSLNNQKQISLKKKFFNNNNSKSYSVLPIKPLINAKTMTNTSLNKTKKYNSREGKDINGRNTNNINSFKENATYTKKSSMINQKLNSNKDSSGINPPIKPVINSKKNNVRQNSPNNRAMHNSKDKHNYIMSTPNLLFDLKNQKNKNKEQSYKIFNNNILISNNNLYNNINKNNNNNNNNHINKSCDKKVNNINKFKGITAKNSPRKNNKLDFDSFEGKKNQNTDDNNNSKITPIKKRNNSLDHSRIKKVSSFTHFHCSNNHNNESGEARKSLASANNEDSDNTRKESGLDLHKIFDDQTFINLEKNNIINEIISNNMKINFSDKSSKNNNNNNIPNANVNINVNTNLNINNNFNRENSKLYNEIKNNEKQKHINYFNNLNKNNDDQNYDSTKNENFSSINENNDNVNINNYKSAKIITNLQEAQNSQDKNSGQTCNTDMISKYIKQQPIYNLSQRYICDEVSWKPINDMPEKTFRFIEDIINENKNMPLIDLRKMLKLSDSNVFRLLSFSYDNYSSIISSNRLVRNKVKISLRNIFQHIIDDFKLKYNNFLNIIKFSFEPKTVTINGKISHLFNLIIECQIITKEVKKSFEIGCDYISYGKKYDNKWKFDVFNKRDIKVWLCSEIDMINNIYKKFTYTSQVPSFCYNDILKLNFNILSEGNNVVPISVEWAEPIITTAKTQIYQNSSYISSIKYDQLRSCEVETQILFWKHNLPSDDDNIIEEFKKIFDKFFKIKNISYDVSKYYFFKFITIANKKGAIKQNKFLSFDINIVDYTSNIKNEIQCIYLMNSNFYTKSMDIRLGTIVTFYIVDMMK